MKKYLAEFIGTACLVFIGCGTACAVGCDAANGSGYILTAFAFGLTVMAMAYAIGPVSGCHVNPAVSIAMLISGKLGFGDFIGYIIAQCLGAYAGGWLMVPFWGKESGLGTNGLYNGDIMLSLLAEAVLTFVFVFLIIMVTSKEENGAIAGLIIGLTLFLVHIIGIAITGTSVNPARSLGPALIVGGDALKNVWVFIAGPFIGGIVAAIFGKIFAE
ncbi:MAG: aquaporin [Blautia sp.]|nr:aquaporin [Blautia sp.]